MNKILLILIVCIGAYYMTKSIIQVFLLLTLLYVFFENEIVIDKYNYDLENPNALVMGKNVAGTVFDSYPDKTPGIGWVL